MRLNERGAILTRALDDGRIVDLYPLTMGRVRVTVSRSITDMSILEGW